MHGSLTALVSFVLGTGAHLLGSGTAPSGEHLLLLGAIALAVGVVDAGGVQRAGRRRAAGRIDRNWPAVLGLIVGGQLAAHTVLSLVGHHHGAAGGGSTLGMLAWHGAAVPVAVAVLVLAQQLLGLLDEVSDRLQTGGPLPAVEAAAHAPGARRVAVAQLWWSTTVSRRGPPALG